MHDGWISRMRDLPNLLMSSGCDRKISLVKLRRTSSKPSGILKSLEYLLFPVLFISNDKVQIYLSKLLSSESKWGAGLMTCFQQ